MRFGKLVVTVAIVSGVYLLGMVTPRVIRELRSAPPRGVQPAAQQLSRHHLLQQSVFEKVGRTCADVVMIGDSLTALGPWNEMLEPLQVANRGIHGDTTAGVLARVDNTTIAPQTLVMMGVNDAIRGLSIQAAITNYEALIDQLTAANKDVVVQSTLLVGANNNPDVNEAIHQINAAAAQSCATHQRCRFVDLNAALAPEGVLHSRFSSDGVHLNGDGYHIWREMLVPYLPKSVRKC